MSLSFSLDALFNQFRPRSPPTSSSSSSSDNGGRLPLSLNLAHPLSSLKRVRPLRGSIRRPGQLSSRPADPSSSFSTFRSVRTCSLLRDPPKPAAFLGPDGLDKLQILDDFLYSRELPHGSLEVRVMDLGELRATVELLASSFSDALWIPARYVRFLEFLVEQYVVQKRAQRPHAATLVVYYRERDAAELQFAGTAEVSFNAMGGNLSPPSPVPPRDAPYICNMTVKQTLRRKGIGRHLLKACEELISKMSSSTAVYLHCRVIDDGPLSLYKKAGYSIIKTDTVLVWLILQQRKHLMFKELALNTLDFLPKKKNTLDFDDQPG